MMMGKLLDFPLTPDEDHYLSDWAGEKGIAP